MANRTAGNDASKPPAGARVRFWFTKYNRPVKIEVYLGRNGVKVYGEDAIEILPESSNMLSVRLRGRE